MKISATLLSFALLLCVSCDSAVEPSTHKIVFSNCVRTYHHVRDGKATAELLLVSGRVNAAGKPEAPYESLFFELFFTDGADAGPIIPGTYSSAGYDVRETPFTFTTGDGFASYYESCGSAGEQAKAYPVESGKITVTGRPGSGYKIKLSVVLNDDWRVEGTYEGEISIPR